MTVGAATVVVTSHRVLVFTPDERPRFREVDRPNVASVTVVSRGRLRYLVWATVCTLLGLGGVVAATLFGVADLAPSPDVEENGEVPGGDPTGEAFGALESLLALVDLAVAALGLAFLVVAGVFLVRYVVSRARRLVIRVHGEEDIELPLERTARGVADDLEGAIRPEGAATADRTGGPADRARDDADPDPIGGESIDPTGADPGADDPVVSRGDRIGSGSERGPTEREPARSGSGAGLEERGDRAGGLDDGDGLETGGSTPIDDEPAVDPLEREAYDEPDDPFDAQGDGFEDGSEWTDDGVDGESEWSAGDQLEEGGDAEDPFDSLADAFGGENGDDAFGNDEFEPASDDAFGTAGDDGFDSLEDGPFDETSRVDEVTLEPDEFSVETTGTVDDEPDSSASDEDDDHDSGTESESGAFDPADEPDASSDGLDGASPESAAETTDDELAEPSAEEAEDGAEPTAGDPDDDTVDAAGTVDETIDDGGGG